ncbi:hypothetical protein IW261DRAFT_1428990 [Armillaria novae-zelandiae]|uniref:Uncharacterized protein n=1 Tax=Armillaria novae-zelandiae TaxID=153914 RepID=A0AA39KFV9_9AGAR|nr:hypothetical protein IW261DRAFT_1428990 [Armillaria novae-zelandiae]
MLPSCDPTTHVNVSIAKSPPDSIIDDQQPPPPASLPFIDLHQLTTVHTDATPSALALTALLMDETALEHPDGNCPDETLSQTDNPMSQSDSNSSCLTQTLNEGSEMGSQDQASSESSDEIQCYQSTVDAVSNLVISVVVACSTQKGIQALEMPVFPQAVRGWPNIDDQGFNLEAQSYQLSLCFKIITRRWLEKQQTGQDDAKGAAKHDLVKLSIQGIESSRITHKERLGQDWCILNGARQLGIFLPAADGGKLYMGCVGSNGCQVSQYVGNDVYAPILESNEGPCVTCFIVKGRPTALLQYDIGLTPNTSSHFVKITENPLTCKISPSLVATPGNEPFQKNENPLLDQPGIVGYRVKKLNLAVYWCFQPTGLSLWIAHLSALKPPKPSRMGMLNDEQNLRYEPLPTFASNSTVWLPLENGIEWLYVQFECKHLLELENFSPSKYFTMAGHNLEE